MKFFYYMSKRLFKKKSYLIILALVPILVWAMRYVSLQESGFLKIALYCEDQRDEFAAEIIDVLVEKESVVLFEQMEELEDAYKALQEQKIDAIWILDENFQELIKNFAKQDAEREPEAAIHVVVREDNVALRLSREKLYGTIAPYLYYYMFEDYVLQFFNEERVVSEEELQQIYQDSAVIDCLVQFSYMDGRSEEELNYLVAPLRGLLALLVVMGGFAGAMFFRQDEEAGVLDHISYEKRLGRLYVYQFTVTLYIGIAVLLALAIIGNATTFIYEAAIMGLFLLMNIGFCGFWALVLQHQSRLGCAMVVCVLLMLILCPIFLTINNARAVQCLLPPFYYLSGIHNPGYLDNMLWYCAVSFGINLLISKIKTKFII